ncbi:MAG: SxtJ family membrane protein [Planctomycetota bacterium]
MIKFNLDPPARQLREFGWFSLFGFPLVAGLLRWRFTIPDWLFYGLIGLGVLCFVLSQIDAKLVKPVFVGLMLVATPIGFVISMVLMLVIYFGLFMPVGLLFRLLGKDPLAKYPNPKLTSYWHVRTTPPSKARYLKLY